MKQLALPVALIPLLMSVLLATTGVSADGTPCPDLNGDGAFNLTDLLILGSYNGQVVPPGPVQADLNKDGTIDSDDTAYIFSLIPPPGGVYTCQDAPIGLAGAVGGDTQLAQPILGDERWLAATWPLAALAAIIGVAVPVLVAARKRS